MTSTTTNTDPLAAQRLFFALWPTPAVVASLSRLAQGYAAQFGGRVMRQETLHLTLAFLGDLAGERLPAVLACADRAFGAAAGDSEQASLPAAPTIVLDQTGYWPRQQLIWAGCSTVPPALLALVERLSTCLADPAGEVWPAAMPAPAHPFMPHLTLLRNVRSAEGLATSLPPLPWATDAVVLVRSLQGLGHAAYQIVKHWPLSTR